VSWYDRKVPIAVRKWLVPALAGLIVSFSLDARATDDRVATFLARRDDPVRSYRARRHMEAENSRFGLKGWLDAVTTLGPDGLSYEVVAEGGSSMIRKRVLRAALDGERDLIRSAETGALTTANYRMVADGEADGWQRIRLEPLRKDRLLIEGWLLVAPGDADLHGVTGRLSKTPSFWTTRVDVNRVYERRAGQRVVVLMESNASVRLAGPSTFVMRYEYEMVNGVAVAR